MSTSSGLGLPCTYNQPCSCPWSRMKRGAIAHMHCYERGRGGSDSEGVAVAAGELWYDHFLATNLCLL